MNKYVYIGKIVGTHGIKGEIRIISDADIKNQIFIPNFPIYIGENKEPLLITSYRHHKNFEMVLLNGFDNINDVLRFKNQKVYVKRDDLSISDYILDDLIGLDVIFNDQVIGKVNDIIKNGSNILLQVDGQRKFYIPKVDDFIISIDIDNNRVYVQNVEGLML